jgi:hypothetical protein
MSMERELSLSPRYWQDVSSGRCHSCRTTAIGLVRPTCREIGEVQKQVTHEGAAGVDVRRATPQIRGFFAGGSLAVASSTPATQLLSPAMMIKLNHAAKSMWGRALDQPHSSVSS